jgi:transposase
MERELAAVARDEPVIRELMQIPGFGIPDNDDATVADIHGLRNGPQLACWFGLTPREFSSRSRRRLGRISKQDDPYVRMLLIQGARSALNAARRAAQADKPLTLLQAWALERAGEMHTNKAAVALANKLARIAWAVWRHERAFGGNHVVLVAA